MTAKAKKPGLYPVFCCGKFLIEAPANTSTYCPHCNRWQNVEGKVKGKLKEGEAVCMK